MSVFGGDSWAREAQYRKRRVEDMLIEGLDGSSYKKLSNGKYVCLVCPHNPVLDSPLMLSMHYKGSRHIAVESRLKERELKRQEEINKRLALSDSHVESSNSNTSNKKFRLSSKPKPLIEQTRKAASEIFCSKPPLQIPRSQPIDVRLSQEYVVNATISATENSYSRPAIMASDKSFAVQHLDFQERRKRELKFIGAGWKRDCHGRWFKDENVSFLSVSAWLNLTLMKKIQMYVLATNLKKDHLGRFLGGMDSHDDQCGVDALQLDMPGGCPFVLFS